LGIPRRWAFRAVRHSAPFGIWRRLGLRRLGLRRLGLRRSPVL